ncbi:MAG: c-type cytochrome [Melioribacteraceae bacterium]|nr:c-type cytochrome [Melioribacteraceae bacterium]
MVILTGLNLFFFYSGVSEGHDLEKILRTMLIVTLVLITFIMWLAFIYSEKEDNNGELFTAPFKKLLQKISNSVPLEKEQEILLHHDYDGIKELDNRIPPWFNFLFYGTIAWGIIYMMVFHVFDNGQVQANEYNSEMQQAAIERQILLKSGALISEETVAVMTDAATLSEGKDIYVKNCVSCHGSGGEGLVGPNLTDDYWIHGGGIKNIFKVIKFGVPAKGMISWQTQLDPSKMQAVSNYILTLHGTNPANGKVPEGEKWVEQTNAQVE